MTEALVKNVQEHEAKTGSSEPWVRADLARYMGGFAGHLGQFEEAMTFFHRSSVLAETANADVLRLNALLGMLGIHAETGKSLAEAQLVATQTKALLDRLGNPPLESIRYYQNLTGLYNRTGQDKQSLLPMQNAVQIARKIYPVKHPKIATVLSNLGSVQYILDKKAEAKKSYQEALEIIQLAYGRNHYIAAQITGNLGNLRKDETGLSLLKEALDIQIAIGKGEHPDAVLSYVNICEKSLYLKHTEGVQYCEQGVELARKAYGTIHESYTWTLLALGRAQFATKQYQEAVTTYKDALSIREQIPGPPISLDQIRFHLAGALLKTQREKRRALQLARLALKGFTERNDTHWIQLMNERQESLEIRL